MEEATRKGSKKTKENEKQEDLIFHTRANCENKSLTISVPIDCFVALFLA
jgi:hypothetical protein